MDRIATIRAKRLYFLAQILADPKDFMDRDAMHGVYNPEPDGTLSAAKRTDPPRRSRPTMLCGGHLFHEIGRAHV